MYKLFYVRLHDWKGEPARFELAAETLQDARIIAAHICNIPVSGISEIKEIGTSNIATIKFYSNFR